MTNNSYRDASESVLPSVLSLPEFAKPLAPYFKPRNEALHIRRALTLYLYSQINFSHSSHHHFPASCSHVSLCYPHNASAVESCSLDLLNSHTDSNYGSDGLRVRYLKALQKNISARRYHGEMNRQINGLQKSECNTTDSSQRDGHGYYHITPPASQSKEPSDFRTYRDLLRSRRELNKLRTFQHYFDKLNNMDAARPHYLPFDEMRAQSFRSAQNPTAVSVVDADASTTSSWSTDVQGLLHKLERAVISAKHRVDVERRELEMVKAQHHLRGGGGAGGNDNSLQHAVSDTSRLRALTRIRGELVTWVEQTLANTSSTNEIARTGNNLLGPEDIFDEDATDALNDMKLLVQEQYMAYTDARKELLLALSPATQAPPANHRTQDAAKPSPDAGTSVTRKNKTADIAELFPYISEVLLPLSKSQRGPSVQKAHLSAILAREKWNTCRVLDRLREESHLLPEYPILARQLRFKHAVSAISGGSRPSSLVTDSPSSEQTNPSEILSGAEAWAFAANETRNATNEYLADKIVHGEETGHHAEDTLREIYKMANQDYDEIMVTTARGKRGEGKGDEDENDIWTQTRSRYGGRQAKGEKRKGPWSSLDGRVGMITDG